MTPTDRNAHRRALYAAAKARKVRLATLEAAMAAQAGAGTGRVHVAPPMATEKGVQFYAKDSDGRWWYVNHAGRWCGTAPPFLIEG